jgi:hypothetical protein
VHVIEVGSGRSRGFNLRRLIQPGDFDADSSTTSTSIPVSSTTTTKDSLAMALKQNLRQAEGILRSVPDPGQIVYDPRFWFLLGLVCLTRSDLPLLLYLLP